MEQSLKITPETLTVLTPEPAEGTLVSQTQPIEKTQTTYQEDQEE